jgi:hypothetical protein
MNVLRSVSRHQRWLLQQLGKGSIRITKESRTFVVTHYYPPPLTPTAIPVSVSKPRGRAALFGGHLQSSIVELYQRGILVEESGGAVVMCREARRQFGTPSALPSPKRFVRMSRTRAARDQGAPPEVDDEE